MSYNNIIRKQWYNCCCYPLVGGGCDYDDVFSLCCVAKKDTAWHSYLYLFTAQRQRATTTTMVVPPIKSASNRGKRHIN